MKKQLKGILALLLIMITVMIPVGSTMAYSWSIGTPILGYPGVDVFGDGRHSTSTVKWVDGKNAYCIQYSAPIDDLFTFVPKNEAEVKLSAEQKNYLRYALAYGFDPKSKDISGKDAVEYCMTQIYIWCITEGYIHNEAKINTARNMAAAYSGDRFGVDPNYAVAYFNKLKNEIELAINHIIPSMMADKAITAKTITLHWNSTNKRYQETLNDTNNVLSSFDFSGLAASGIGAEINGNRVTFYKNTYITGTSATVQFNPVAGSYAAKHSSASVTYWCNVTDTGLDEQDVVTFKLTPDPLKGFAKFNTEESGLRIKKVSSDNGEPLNNVTFDIYADAECTKLVRSVITGTVNGESGIADITGLATGMTYYVSEREGAGAVNHRHLDGTAAVTIKSGTNVIEIKNDRVPVTVTLTKKDGDTNKGIAGAVYSLYAREDIKAAAGDSILYTAGSWVADFAATGDDGQAVLNDLYIGKYYVKEKTAPPSGIYDIDDTEYEVDALASSKDFASDAVINVSVSVTEPYSGGYIKVIKTDSAAGDKLKSAVIGIYKDKDCMELVDRLVTDEYGEAVSKKLDRETYYLKELNAPAGYVAGVTVYEGKVTPADTATVEIKNEPIKVSVSKTSVTGDCPEIPGAELVIRAAKDISDASGEIIYVAGDEVESWTSTEEAHVIDAIPAGKYTLTELRTPFGYQAAETVEFTVEETGEIQTVEMPDAETYGKIIINKTDEKTGKPLEGVTFEVRTAEDILAADGSIVTAAGTVVDTLVTDENGYAKSKELPIGTYGTEGFTSYIKYELQEIKTLDGYTAGDTIYPIEFTYVDDRTPVIERVFDITNVCEETSKVREIGSTTHLAATEAIKTPAPETGDFGSGALVWFVLIIFSVLSLIIVLLLLFPISHNKTNL